MINTQVIILAAGEGKRMNSGDIPKVLVPFHGKPLIKHLLESIAKSGVCDKPLIVVGKHAQAIISALGDDYLYVTQTEQLGTGHAVAVTKETLQGKADRMIVLYGDHPLVRAETIRQISGGVQAGTVITMATATVEDFEDWRIPFKDFSRIIRSENGNIIRLVEAKDATAEELAIKEVNPGYYNFDAAWLWENLDKINNQNVQGEYYLTDLIKLAIDQGKKITTVSIEPTEALGVNTQDQLSNLRNF